MDPAPWLTGPARALRVTCCDETDSTNTRLRERAADGEPAFAVLIADRQTGGRGRRGRSFHSPAGTGLYMSVLLRPALPATDALLLTTAAAVAVCEALETRTGRSAGIKWVNDVFLDGKKVCGILTESACDPETGALSYAVVGMGVNVFAPAGGFPPELATIAGSVYPAGAAESPTARARLAAEILNRLMGYAAHLREKPFVAAYRARSLALGRRVTIVGTDEHVQAIDVDDQCRLRVRAEDGTERWLSSGEISIRLNAM